MSLSSSDRFTEAEESPENALVFPRHHEEKFTRWRNWIDSIESEVNELVTLRGFFRYMRDLIKANEDAGTALTGTHFFAFMARMYVSCQAATVRRMVELSDRNRPLSLALFLRDMMNNPEVFSRDRYMAGWGSPDPNSESIGQRHTAQIANDLWAEVCEPEGRHIAPAMIDEDLSGLIAASQKVDRYVDRYIAHADPQGMKGPPTFKDLHDAIEAIYEVFVKYRTLITGSARAQVPILLYDWNRQFRIPWLREGITAPLPPDTPWRETPHEGSAS